ncbi:MAG: prepilin-type N-terminal cleavage/methylation domain-containing protein [Magnetococcus sp. DMHC-1]|nr:prepilin-type N-terminal cleavage/methylation domain-containing protein [Magnetococcales bacterium]
MSATRRRNRKSMQISGFLGCFSVPIRGNVAGFTLIEMAIVMVIAGLMLGGAINAIHAQSLKRRAEKTHDQLVEIKESIFGFALANGRLPCPDTDFDGLENQTAGVTCVANASGLFRGFIPWRTLGVAPVDPWSHLFTYQVTGVYADDISQNSYNGCNAPTNATSETSSSFALTCPAGVTDGDITIRDSRDSANPVIGRVIATGIPAVFMSHGANSFGAFTLNGNQISTAGAQTLEEQTNFDATSSTFSRGGDDVVMWISPLVLKFRTVQARRLP